MHSHRIDQRQETVKVHGGNTKEPNRSLIRTIREVPGGESGRVQLERVAEDAVECSVVELGEGEVSVC